MDFDISYSLENEGQFWEELEEIVSAVPSSEVACNGFLQSFIHLASAYRAEYLQTRAELARCSDLFLGSAAFAAHPNALRHACIEQLDPVTQEECLCITASIILNDGHRHEETFELVNREKRTAQLIALLEKCRGSNIELHSMLLHIFYEMARLQRLGTEDLRMIDDDFIAGLLAMIEEIATNTDDPYHYSLVSSLLVLNEQYMVSVHALEGDEQPVTNRVVKVLSLEGSSYKTFGENIILLLNRESETSMQLLILKLLYLLFTNKATYEYFYTNDLRVLVDVVIRNLLDLPDEAAPLRHTYLRVLYPLLAHTQLNHPPHYKREDLRRMLDLLSEVNDEHFRPADQTTVRLVERCKRVPWLTDEPESPLNGLLGMSLNTAQKSSISVLEVAGLKEKPGVQTPSRKGPPTKPRRRCVSNGLQSLRVTSQS